jgi:hypothetical protein
MKALPRPIVDNWKLIALTFEAFWVLVFVLHAATSSSGAQVAQFVYANF